MYCMRGVRAVEEATGRKHSCLGSVGWNVDLLSFCDFRGGQSGSCDVYYLKKSIYFFSLVE